MLDRDTLKRTYESQTPERRKDWVTHILQLRAERRGAYSTKEGLRILTQMVKDSGLFADTGEDTSRNFVIRILESMGILDENNIESIVRFMVKNTTVFPKELLDRVSKEK